jgi:Peptidase_C39 like family
MRRLLPLFACLVLGSALSAPVYSTTTHLTVALPSSAAGVRVVTGERLSVAPFDELVPSWNAVVGPGGSLTLEVRAQLPGGEWTRYYSFGRWLPGPGRASAESVRDAAGTLNTDTLTLNGRSTRYSYRLTLRGPVSVTALSFSTADRSRRTAGLGRAGGLGWGRSLDVPPRSQMIYKNGGEVWCSPTSVSMILAYWGDRVPVPEAAAATLDPVYGGTGNWSFNVAWAGTRQGVAGPIAAHVARLDSLAAAERYLAAGVPLALSLGWRVGELPGAAIPSSAGHLVVLVGFDAAGNPVINDPAAASDAAVRRTYPRAAFERLWLTHSGGTAYVIAPSRQPLPE